MGWKARLVMEKTLLDQVMIWKRLKGQNPAIYTGIVPYRAEI